MRALIPVALPRSWENKSESMRNKWVMVSANLAVSETTVQARLKATNTTMNSIKNSMIVIVQDFLQSHILSLLPQFIARQIAYDIFSRHSMVFSNVPGPPDDVYLADRKMIGMQVVFPNILHQCLLISYRGGIFMNMVIDPKVITDEKVLVNAFFEELSELAGTYNIKNDDKSIYL